MPEYAWKALTPDGRTQKGKANAKDLATLSQQLEQAGLMLLKAKAVRSLFSMGEQKIKLESILNFSFQLSMMLRAGVTLLEALNDIATAEGNPAMRRVIGTLADSLASGKTLSQSMAAQPKVFDKVYVNLIQAGEQTGQLTEVLEDLTETLKWQHEMASQTKKALTYPIIVLIVITGVLIFMLAYVVPQITQLLQVMKIPLPWPTKVLIFLSDSILNHWKLLLLIFGSLIVSGIFFAKIPPAMRGWVDRMKLKLPIVGKVLERIALARFSYILAMLYAAGITVPEALIVVEQVVGNQAMAQSIQSARMQIGKGKNLSTAFASGEFFPPMVISMLRVGEATGSLDKALKNVSYMYTREAREAVENLQASLQPILTVVLGLILAAVMVFTLGPLYESVIGGGGKF